MRQFAFTLTGVIKEKSTADAALAMERVATAIDRLYSEISDVLCVEIHDCTPEEPPKPKRRKKER